MAFSKTQISAAEKALFDADKPLLYTNQKGLGATMKWVRTQDFTATDETSTAAGRYARYAIDEYNHLITEPDEVLTTWFMAFDFGSSGIEFDTIVLVNHNLNGATFRVQVSDAATFTSPETLIDTTLASSKRIPFYALFGGNGYRYSSVRYLAIRLGGLGGTPYVGEVWFLRRYQLTYKPERPYGDWDNSSPTDRSETYTGIVTDVARGTSRRRKLDARFTLDSTQAVDFRAWMNALDGGRKTFAWVDNPTSTPTELFFMKLDDPAFASQQIDLYREFTLRASEQGPFFVWSE